MNDQNCKDPGLQTSGECREMTLAEVEQEYIVRVLKAKQGNKTIAAQTLGITVKTLYNKLHEYGMMAKTKSEAK